MIRSRSALPWQATATAGADLCLRPAWVRAVALVAVTGFHGAVVGGLGRFASEVPAAPGQFEVGVISRGEIAFDAQSLPVPESMTISALPESALVPDAPQQSSEQVPDLPDPVLKSDEEAEQPKKRIDAPESASPAPPVPATQASAAMIGAEGHQADVPRLSISRYAAIVSAEINRHKHYPREARLRGERGSVGIAFTVERSGRVISSMVIKSSGSRMLDDAASAMVAAAKLPSPPGGRFRGEIRITFRTKD